MADYNWSLEVKYAIPPLNEWLPGYWPVRRFSSEKKGIVEGLKFQSEHPGIIETFRVIDTRRTTWSM